MGKYVTANEVEEIIDRKVGFFVEHMATRFDQIFEIITIMRKELAQKPDRSELEEVKTDVRTIKQALTAINHDVRKLNKRVIKLESVAHSHA